MHKKDACTHLSAKFETDGGFDMRMFLAPLCMYWFSAVSKMQSLIPEAPGEVIKEKTPQ